MHSCFRFLSLTLLFVFTTVSCQSGDPFSVDNAPDTDPRTVIVGSAASPESEAIADLYIAALRVNGFHAGGKQGVGQREGYLPALSSGEISVIPDYTGNLLHYLNKDTHAVTGEDIKKELDLALSALKVVAYTPAPASNTDSITVTKRLATQWNLTTIADLLPHAQKVRIAANAEFLRREQGIIGLQKIYGILIPSDQFVSINDSSGPATQSALRSGQVQAANIYTTTPTLAKGDLVPLQDPEGLFPPNNIVPLVSVHKDTPLLRQVLDAVSQQLTTEDVIQLNRTISGEGTQEPEEAAAEWISAHGLDKPLTQRHS